jgi:hypothetical protein
MEYCVIGRAHSPTPERWTFHCGTFSNQLVGEIKETPNHCIPGHWSLLVLINEFVMGNRTVQKDKSILASINEFRSDLMKGIDQPHRWHLSLFEMRRDAKNRTAVEILFRFDCRTLKSDVRKALTEKLGDNSIDFIISHGPAP